ncbi:MAG: molybdate ABC transporter substrate-binding protein [Thermodesulfobacteriota bacterium]
MTGIKPTITSEEDLHNLEYMEDADLVLFMAGNQFMAMDELVNAFQQDYPEVKKIFYETLPPRLMLNQILHDGALFEGKVITGHPDIYSAVKESSMETLKDKGLINDYFIYLHNRIVLVVPGDNPAGIKTVTDLQREDVRISQPSPDTEDIAHHIIEMYRQAGGDELVKRIMEEKRSEGTTIFTVVHHRETPLRLRKKTVDVGPVWATEVIEAKEKGQKVDMIDPGRELDQRSNISYYIAGLNNSSNPKNARKFMSFIKGRKAQHIYSRYGFVPHFE